MRYSKINDACYRIRNKSWLSVLIVLTRYLIGFAFIPSGLKKILGERFTQIKTDNPIGFFFEGLYRSGIYWNFRGWAQVVAALLLMTHRFATLGAIVFFFIVSNIWVITISLHFSDTWVITTLMLLSVIILLAWDYHKLKYIFYADDYRVQLPPGKFPATDSTWIITGFILFAWSITGLLLLESLESSNKLFSRIWLAGILLTVSVALYLNHRKKNKIVLP